MAGAKDTPLTYIKRASAAAFQLACTRRRQGFISLAGRIQPHHIQVAVAPTVGASFAASASWFGAAGASNHFHFRVDRSAPSSGAPGEAGEVALFRSFRESW
jgi:hypothetical protein